MDVEGIIDPHHEVKKLQDLVKKLERQNEALRTKQDAVRQRNGDVDLFSENSRNIDDAQKTLSSFDKGLQTLEDFDDVDYSDDDLW